MTLLKKGAKAKHPNAIFNLGSHYYEGSFGLDQDYNKAIVLWTESGELGNAQSYYNIGTYYCTIVQNVTRGLYYYEKAAIGGCIPARYTLALLKRGLMLRDP
jgi:TPR repeat protein